MKRPNGIWILLFSICSLLAAILGAVAYGSTSVSVSHIAGILGQALGLPTETIWRPWESTVILHVRMPRVLVGAFVGGGLALSGAAMQGLFRNPLASPDVLGVSTGATVGAVLAFYFGLAARTVWAIPLLAALGGGITIFLVYAIATRRGQTPISTLLLAGIALGSLNGAIVSLILSLSLADYRISGEIIKWTLGGLDGRTWDHVKLVAPAVLLGSALIMLYWRDLDALLLGETQAAAVGVDVEKVRRLLLAACAVITGAAVAVSGTIGFVGLVIPHILRLILGPGHRWLLPASLFTGAAFVVLADLVARTAIAPEEIRLGVITAAIGAPFFLFLLLRQRKEGRW